MMKKKTKDALIYEALRRSIIELISNELFDNGFLDASEYIDKKYLED